MSNTAPLSKTNSFVESPYNKSKPRPKSAFRRTPNNHNIHNPQSAFDSILTGTPNRASSAPQPKSVSFEKIPTTDSKSKSNDSPMIKSTVAYRRYNPVYPTANRLLSKICDDAARKRHLEKLLSIRSQVDNEPPKEYAHIYCQWKKNLKIKERLDEIKQQDKILTQRLARMTKQSIVDMKNESSFGAHASTIPIGDRRRKEESERIELENIVLIQRVEDRKPTYQKQNWKKDRLKNLVYLNNISMFPEGYTSILQKHGIISQNPQTQPSPIKIKMNRSVILQKEAQLIRAQSAPADIKLSQPSNIGMTRSVILRNEFLRNKILEEERRELELDPRRKAFE